ncbi:MAG: hypothetical protein Q8T11_12345 [Elusimicrobiota bacterium]|nr:hypothetical protein [Elusimicrobiota bacterium]
MSEWREQRESEPWDWDTIKKMTLLGAGCGAAVIAWMMFASPGEEAASSRGFDMGYAGSAPSGRPFAARPTTSLDMVSSKIGDGPPGVTSSLYRQAPAQDDPPAPEAAASPPRSGAPPAQAEAPPAAAVPPSPAEEAQDLAKAGIPTDAKGLGELGAKPGLLSSLAAKLLDHPKVMAAVFNNKTVVHAFMSRPGVKQNCESGGALKAYLSDPGSGGMTKVLPVIQQALGRPQTSGALVSALAGTEMAKQLGACPSLKQVGNDPSAIASIAMANPKALGVLMDPRSAAALAANPQAAAAFASVTSKLGGGK